MKIPSYFSAALVFTMGFAPLSQAALFTGTATGQWLDVISTVGDSTSVANNDNGGLATFNWGVAATTPFNNQFSFDGVGSDGDTSWSADLGDVFLIGEFNYRNGSTYQSLTVDGVSLDIALSIIDPVLATGIYNVNQSFAIENTPNVTGNNVLDGDIVNLLGEASNSYFSYGGVNYVLEILGFSNDGGFSLIYDFSSPEGGTAGAGFYARFNTVSAPTPSTLFLLATGLIAVVRLRKRV